MTILSVLHVTVYRYRVPVVFGDHRMGPGVGFVTECAALVHVAVPPGLRQLIVPSTERSWIPNPLPRSGGLSSTSSSTVKGSRRLQVALSREGVPVGRRRIRRLMKKLGLWAVRPKRNTSKPNPTHKVYPYLLRGKVIDQPNQVWATDVTYIPMRRGFLYLVAIIDWATRRLLGLLDLNFRSDFLPIFIIGPYRNEPRTEIRKILAILAEDDSSNQAA